jgi:outer membrane protein OmpU
MTETEGKIMKKILIATTALVATASVAAAEVRLSGYARFGAQYNEGTAAVAATAGAVSAADVTAAAALTAPVVLVAGATTAANIATVDTAATAAAAVTLAAQQAHDALQTAATAAALAAATTQEANIAALRAAIAGTPAVAAVADDTNVVSRVRFQLDASTTTDAGVGLNVRQRIQSEENGTNDTNGGRFGLTYGGVAVNVGNINGVIESTPNLYMNTNSAGVGLEGNGFHSLATNNAGGSWGWTAYSSGGAGATNGVEVIYSANGLRLHASDSDGATAYGASFAMGDITVGAGYEDLDAGGSITLITAGMNIGNGWVALAHGINESAAGVDVAKTSLKGGYDVAAGMNVYGFVATEDAGNASGVGMSYDLGGGASFDAGYTTTAASRGVLSAGVFFTF